MPSSTSRAEHRWRGRWSDAFKTKVFESRVSSTRHLLESCRKMKSPPKQFLGASAVGIYGAQRIDPCSEDAEPGTDFLAHVCKHWELEAQKQKT